LCGELVCARESPPCSQCAQQMGGAVAHLDVRRGGGVALRARRDGGFGGQR